METVKISKDSFTRIANDLNGNPRYVIHFLELLTANERWYSNLDISEKYQLAIKKANKIGGKKYHNKSYGGGIVFQSYNLDQLITTIENK